MPILKATEPIPQRPVVIALYGEPGSAKTSLGNTADDVIVLDADRGVSRSFNRQDTLVIDKWEDVETEMKAGTLKAYKTIVIDTAKAVLDDFLMSHVISRDFKLKTNKLRAYGEIGEEFKLFVNYCRNEGKDLIIIAHAKKDEDTKKSIPDVTGQSYQLILRISDQVGYVSFVNNVRNIQWTPTDLTVGKNTANLPTIQVPDKTDPAFRNFMGQVIASVKKSISELSEAQQEAIKQMDAYRQRLDEVNTPEAMTALLTEVNTLAPHYKTPMVKLIVEKAKVLGYVANKEKKIYELPAPIDAPPETPTVTEGEKTDIIISEDDFNFRVKMLTDTGMVPEGDRLSLGDIVVTYTDLSTMNETRFNDIIRDIVKVRAKKSAATTGSTRKREVTA